MNNTAFTLMEELLDRDRTVRVPKIFIEFAGDFTTAVFLSQCYYWQKRTARRDDYFYKSDKEWYEEIYISKDQRQRATRILMSQGILSVKLVKANGVPTNHYFLDVHKLFESLEEFIIRRETPHPIEEKVVNGKEEKSSMINIDVDIDVDTISFKEDEPPVEKPVREKKQRARKEPQYPTEVQTLYQEVKEVLKRGAVSRDWLVEQLKTNTREEILEAARLAFKADAIRYPATYMFKCLERISFDRQVKSQKEHTQVRENSHIDEIIRRRREEAGIGRSYPTGV